MSSMDESDAARLARELAQMRKRMTRIEERLDDLEHGDQGPKQRLEKLIAHAARVRQNGEDKSFNYSEISAATGASPTTVYKDIEKFPDLREGVQKHQTPSGEMRIVIDGSISPGEKYNET